MRYRIFLDSTDVCVYIHTKCITRNFMNGNGIRQPTTEIVYNLILYFSCNFRWVELYLQGRFSSKMSIFGLRLLSTFLLF